MEESEEEVEIVEDNVDPPEEEVQDVDDGSGDKEPPDSDEEEVSTKVHLQNVLRLTESQDDDLTNHQRGAELEEKTVKKDSTLDLLTIMSDKVTVRFKIAHEKYLEEKGRWCNTCK